MSPSATKVPARDTTSSPSADAAQHLDVAVGARAELDRNRLDAAVLDLLQESVAVGIDDRRRRHRDGTAAHGLDLGAAEIADARNRLGRQRDADHAEPRALVHLGPDQPDLALDRGAPAGDADRGRHALGKPRQRRFGDVGRAARTRRRWPAGTAARPTTTRYRPAWRCAPAPARRPAPSPRSCRSGCRCSSSGHRPRAIWACDATSARLADSSFALALSDALTALSSSALVAKPFFCSVLARSSASPACLTDNLGVGDLRLASARCWPRPGRGSPRSGQAACRASSGRGRRGYRPSSRRRPGRR